MPLLPVHWSVSAIKCCWRSLRNKINTNEAALRLVSPWSDKSHEEKQQHKTKIKREKECGVV